MTPPPLWVHSVTCLSYASTFQAQFLAHGNQICQYRNYFETRDCYHWVHREFYITSGPVKYSPYLTKTLHGRSHSSSRSRSFKRYYTYSWLFRAHGRHFRQAMVRILSSFSGVKTIRVWYATEGSTMYGTIMYLLSPNWAKWAWYLSHIRLVTWYRRISAQHTRLLIG